MPKPCGMDLGRLISGLLSSVSRLLTDVSGLLTSANGLLVLKNDFSRTRVYLDSKRKNDASYVSYVSTACVTMLHQTKSGVDT